MGETPHLFPVLVGLRAFYLVRAELPRARELAEQLWRLAQRTPDPACLLAAHQALGHTLFQLGELAVARKHLQEGITFYAPQHPSFRTLAGEQDLKMFCLAYLARVLWLLGYPDQALQRSDDALTHARQLAQPYTLAHALWYGLSIHEWRGEADTAWEWSEAVMTLATEQGVAQQLAEGTFRRNLRWLTQGQGEAGRALVRQGLAAYRATGAEIRRPYYLALLAETHGHVGQSQDGLAVLAGAMRAMDNTGERWWAAELYRLKGELLLVVSAERHTEAETCLHQALDMARRQEAKALELRATMSLARLWQRQGKRAEARRLLADIYGWFTEGFDTADLQEAKALLEELS